MHEVIHEFVDALLLDGGAVYQEYVAHHGLVGIVEPPLEFGYLVALAAELVAVLGDISSCQFDAPAQVIDRLHLLLCPYIRTQLQHRVEIV